ncbi:MAG TPA: hypothetical protein VGJ15_05175 [Pirellulales bacterium]
MKGLPWFRWLRRPIQVEELDAKLSESPDWKVLRGEIKPGDKIWPFKLHARKYLGMRQGFLVLRCDKPIGGIVTLVS